MTVMSSIKSYSELNFISFIKLNHRESLDKFKATDRKKSVFFNEDTLDSLGDRSLYWNHNVRAY